MKKFSALFLLACLVVCFAARPALAQDADKTPNILVDDDKVQCPTAAYTSIQAAVNAAKSGDVIRVCAGTYREQVVIDKSLSVEADNGVIVIPSNVVANSAGASSGEASASVRLWAVCKPGPEEHGEGCFPHDVSHRRAVSPDLIKPRVQAICRRRAFEHAALTAAPVTRRLTDHR